ncbi:Response regulator receiver domain-containing protein [Prosthecobacter debontii]|uniref:histidine kinase n=1 Tax=Prosthecobacter debontii TaxID=48467 RepID=A0A1T4XT02_9BACT|nr:response regulator [Prosthecobacter debontii]SKA92225.1 Response regulator receiver domain-containing protein [Prosthecobacter debontii]
MHTSQPLGKLPAKYQVLIASAAESTTRLLQPLQHIGQTEGVTDSGGLFVLPRQRFVFHPLEHNVLNIVLRSFQADTPVAVVIVDVQPGTESTAEQLINALYHADGTLGVIVLLGEGASLSATLLEQITHSPRLTFVQMPGTLPQIFQIVKIMLMSWHAQRRLADPAANKAAETGAAALGGHLAPDVPVEAPPMHLEIVGSLAAGIAHEFNNVLTVIQSQMDMAMKQAGEVPGVLNLLTQVMETARSASTLSRKLVSFTPDEGSSPAAVDLTASLKEEVMLLNKTLGDHFTLEVSHSADLPKVWADPSTISQLIINVALHARNGMPDGGRLQISTSKISHQTGCKFARLFPEAAHGDYVMLTIEDPNPSDEVSVTDPSQVVVTLPPSVQRAADDRLAWIQRTIQAAGGGLNVTLLPGMVRLYQLLFPLASDHQEEGDVAESAPHSSPPIPEIISGEVPPSTVLVVDDDDTICMIMSQVLATEKHRVLTAKSADEAWQQWCKHRSSIKLLITDINMPGGANGVALGHAIQEQDGSVPVIYTSGHRAVHQFAELEVGTNYLPKPFGMNDLLAVANRALMSHRSHGLS